MVQNTPANLRRFDGLADTYDAHRPRPPQAMLEFLCQYAQAARPVVVDLGSGTGLSTRAWRGIAACVTGVEPNGDMIRRAREIACPGETRVEYVQATSSATGLAGGSADIITCGQSLHWMEPEPTFAEAARILRPGGVFAAYDCDWPPAVHPDLDLAYRAFDDRVRNMERQRAATGPKRWAKHEHLARMQASGRFRYVGEVVFNNPEKSSAQRLVGLALSQAGCAALLREGVSEEELGLAALRDVVKRAVGDDKLTFHFSYRVRIGSR